MMEKFRLREGEDHIKLGQLLKACNMVYSGAEAKTVINEGLVKVNDEVCELRGKKIRKNDVVIFDEKEVRVVQ